MHHMLMTNVPQTLFCNPNEIVRQTLSTGQTSNLATVRWCKDVVKHGLARGGARDMNDVRVGACADRGLCVVDRRAVVHVVSES